MGGAIEVDWKSDPGCEEEWEREGGGEVEERGGGGGETLFVSLLNV